jgi:hypothetical protein
MSARTMYLDTCVKPALVVCVLVTLAALPAQAQLNGEYPIQIW